MAQSKAGVALAVAAVLAAAAPSAAQQTIDDVIRQLLDQEAALPAPSQTEARGYAVLRGLDTFSGEVATFVAAVGADTPYLRLTIRVLACYSVDDDSDAFSFMEIQDPRYSADPMFRGWMIASSPALSALDHPRYDIWVQRCSTSADPAS